MSEQGETAGTTCVDVAGGVDIPTLWLALITIGCESSVPTDMVESLAADPGRLKRAQSQCLLDRVRMAIRSVMRPARRSASALWAMPLLIPHL